MSLCKGGFSQQKGSVFKKGGLLARDVSLQTNSFCKGVVGGGLVFVTEMPLCKGGFSVQKGSAFITWGLITRGLNCGMTPWDGLPLIP
eukprot:3754431-Amphidinium_carterae.1